jgi:hypothetical protein
MAEKGRPTKTYLALSKNQSRMDGIFNGSLEGDLEGMVDGSLEGD